MHIFIISKQNDKTVIKVLILKKDTLAKMPALISYTYFNIMKRIICMDGIRLFLYFEKAFDFLEYNLMFKTLEKFNFEEQFINIYM